MVVVPDPVIKKQSFYWTRVFHFMKDTFCADDVDDQLYVAGTQRINYYEAKSRLQIVIADPGDEALPLGARAYEEAFFQELLEPRLTNFHVLLGGLGAGKTTTTQYILRQFAQRRLALLAGRDCKCDGACTRSPIYLNFKVFTPQAAREDGSAIPYIFRAIRTAVLDRLIHAWLSQHGIEPDALHKLHHASFKVLRRLIIANDLLRFGESDSEVLGDLDRDQMHLAEPLLSTVPTVDSIGKLVLRFRGPSDRFEHVLRQRRKSIEWTTSFLTAVLRLYVRNCSQHNPLNLIIVDNVDQLQTRYIQELMRQLHSIAAHVEGLPLLMPLRPSSLGLQGYVREVIPRFHYGPNNFAVVLSRLQKYVLGLSREDLLVRRSTAQDESSGRPFNIGPPEITDAELNTLLVVSYIYAKIMEGGLRRSGVPVPDVSVHPDHAFLARVDLLDDVLRDLADTVDALSGVCCRYALNCAMRFYDNAYHSQVIGDLVASLARNSNHPQRMQYVDLVHWLLSDSPSSATDVPRVVNLFRATPLETVEEIPGLAKLRTISTLVAEQRLPVAGLAQRLGLFGIPIEVVVEALSSLQEKFRLLLWLSSSEESDQLYPAILNEEVVISEHGENYFAKVIGDFEYLWHCASSLEHKRRSELRLPFTVKLNSYLNLIRRLGSAEWEQITFNRMRSQHLSDLPGIGSSEHMIVLDVLFASVGRALSAIAIAINQPDTRKLSVELISLLREVCQEVLFWQNRYRKAFGSNYYLSVYEPQLGKLRYDATRLQGDRRLPDEAHAQLTALQSSWQEAQVSGEAVEWSKIDPVPIDDLARVLALSKAVSNSDREPFPGQDYAHFIERHLRSRSQITEQLTHRVPTYTDLLRQLGRMYDDLERALAAIGAGVETKNVKNWCESERAWVLRSRESLSQNQYDVPQVCSIDEMAELWARHYHIMAVVERLAGDLGIEDAEHLSSRRR